MGTRPGFGPKIGERRGEPGYVTNPDELFPNGLNETPNLMSGMYQDFLDKSLRTTSLGQTISRARDDTRAGRATGSRGSCRGSSENGPVVTGREADVNAPASKLQRDMVQAELHRRSLQTPQPHARSEAEVKAEMANRYRQDPNTYYGEGVASGAIGADQNVKRTESGVNLSGAKAENLSTNRVHTEDAHAAYCADASEHRQGATGSRRDEESHGPQAPEDAGRDHEE